MRHPRVLALAILLLLSGRVASATFPAVIDAGDLDPNDALVLEGIAFGDLLGWSVSAAGDVNDDGFNDLIVGAPSPAIGNGGEAYVVFGGPSLRGAGRLNVATLDGSNGFSMSALALGDSLGIAVSTAGDVNNDGVADLLVGAPEAGANGGGDLGEAYVVFGGAGLGAGGTVDLGTLDGSNGFSIREATDGGTLGRQARNAGDLNDDGVDDLIFGASDADPNGRAYVLYGATGLGAGGQLDLATLTGPDGFVIEPATGDEFLGQAPRGVGDVNADGVADLAVAAFGADVEGTINAGRVHVVFGGAGLGGGGVIDLDGLDGGNGFSFTGLAQNTSLGTEVSAAGDLNADGVADFVVNGRQPEAAYVVFGSPDLGASGEIDLAGLTGASGFRLVGANSDEDFARALSAAGDVNNDGVDDLIIGAPGVDALGGGDTGEAYVVFGGSVIGASGEFDVDDLDGVNGFTVIAARGDEGIGLSVGGLGDVDGDGVDDVIIGAVLARPNGVEAAGQAYVIFGRIPEPTTIALAALAMMGFGGRRPS